MDLNNVVIQGRLTKDPDLKYLESGTAKVFFTIAINSYRGGNERTDFIPVNAYGNLAENIAKYLEKGSYLSVEGCLESSTYEKNGERVYYVGVLAQRSNFHSFNNKNGSSEDRPKETKVVEEDDGKKLSDLMGETEELFEDELTDMADDMFG